MSDSKFTERNDEIIWEGRLSSTEQCLVRVLKLAEDDAFVECFINGDWTSDIPDSLAAEAYMLAMFSFRDLSIRLEERIKVVHNA